MKYRVYYIESGDEATGETHGRFQRSLKRLIIVL